MPLSDAVSEYYHYLPSPQSCGRREGRDDSRERTDSADFVPLPKYDFLHRQAAQIGQVHWGRVHYWLCPVWLADADRLASPAHALPQKTHPFVLTANHWQAGQAQ